MLEMLERGERYEFPAVVVLLVAALGLWLTGLRDAADLAMIAATTIAFVPALVHSIIQVVRREHGVDVIAVLAMAGTLAFGEYLAGAVLAVMLTGGEALEEHAVGRARRELTSLLARAPRVAHRRTVGEGLEDIAVEDVVAGELLVVKGGEVLPTDGVLRSARAVLDTSALTGESRPVEAATGASLQSGTVNAGSAIEMLVTAPAAASTYAGIVRLVEQAASEKAPFVRMADRYATWFVWLTLALAGLAYAISGDPVRSLAVLVVATPCPLILAAPAAIVGGISRAARHGIIVKGGAVIESLAGGQIVLLDKTGTITSGRPTVWRLHLLDDADEDRVLTLAGSLEQVSLHPFAPAIVRAATARGLALTVPQDVDEELGRGITGTVDGVRVSVGRLDLVAGGRPPGVALRRVRRRAALEGASVVHVGIDGVPVGAFLLRDPIRPEAPGAIRALKRNGIRAVLMVTGDRSEIADIVADSVGIDRVLAERAPSEKVDAVREVQREGRTIMVGDGINDAPALAAADIGIAMGARGATAASEAADVVVTADRLSAVADAVAIARRTRRIAWQSVVAGMGMAAVGMVAATAGLLTPVAGALLQEAIDLAVLANALRALREPPGRGRRRALTPLPADVLRVHDDVRAGVPRLGEVADHLEDEGATPATLEMLDRVRVFLEDELLPHELEEERTLYPIVAARLGADDPTAILARSHRDITRRVRLLGHLIEDLRADGIDDEEVLELRRSLWGLEAVLELHIALEDEAFSAAGPESPADVTK
jgi:heavy metal translocating P-type ATPase